MVELFIIIGAGLAGLYGGWLFSRKQSRQIVEKARVQGGQQIEQAKGRVQLILGEAKARVREEVAQITEATEVLARQAAEQNTLLEERIRKLESRQEDHETEHAAQHAALQTREQACQAVQTEARQVRQQAKDLRQAYQDQIAEKVGETAQQIMTRLAESLIEESRAQCADRLRNLESTSNEEFMRQAKRIMGISMGRYRGQMGPERTTSSLPLSAAGAQKLLSGSGLITTIEEATGIHLIFADDREWVRFEGSDGVARELARRIVTRVIAEEKVRDLPRLIKAIATDLEREIIEMGKAAFSTLNLELAHLELVKLVGRLNFRTSYTQNQWQHALESSFLAGLMATELGLDVTLARRATLLHDIGKALTHEVEGSHAVIGADLARTYGETPLVVNAIASHHGDEPPTSPYAYLVAASDAMSGARPGARREMVETYVDRISDLERISNQFSGIVAVHAVQAGRELRVHVDEQQIDDARAASLSEEIARKISDELTFPGQIRVMVIREFKAVEFAS